ncbi:hypothetical protein [Mesorhizobium sp. 113-1-2]|uniref:hypothetical protein n=1 Tax=Mesorhizobium sp. 113-1-2 TaxID=2744515 RepID=UPI00192917E2|nr:hypothetical protein [Mesorhizobium sp. 113-1-2]
MKMLVIFRSHSRNNNAALINQAREKTSAMPQHRRTTSKAKASSCTNRAAGHRLLHRRCPHAKSGTPLGDAPA